MTTQLNQAPLDQTKAEKSTYWKLRADSVYLHAARLTCRRFGKAPKSVLDVGSNGTPTLEWHRASADVLVSLDLRRPYRAGGVTSIISDLLLYQPEEKFDLVTCFQVLEHVPEPAAFARKLLHLGKVVVVSVPYKWPKGKCRFHPNDPVDEAKLFAWFGIEPVFSHLSQEIALDRASRLIHVYMLSAPKKKRAQPGKAKESPTPLHRRILRRIRKEMLRLTGSRRRPTQR